MTPLDNTQASAPTRLRMAVAMLGVAALMAWCYSPAWHAWFAIDDYVFLAISRLLHEPWALFAHDHFPGSQYFRPLGVLAWWLTSAAVGPSAVGHYLVNFILHGCGVAALYLLLRRLSCNAPSSLAWTAIYAVSPIAISTALWLSDRFDLLNTLFTLLAVNVALRHAEQPRVKTLAGLLLLLLLALMSKETGVVACAAAWLALALAPQRGLPPMQRGMALIMIVMLVAGWLIHRSVVLDRFGLAASEIPDMATLLHGIARWHAIGAHYLFADPRLPLYGRIALASVALIWLGLLIFHARTARAALPARHVSAAILALFVLPALVQAPTAVYAIDVTPEAAPDTLIRFCRLYQLSFAGLVCILSLATRSTTAQFRLSNGLRLTATLLVLLAFAPLSHELARGYAQHTRGPATLELALESTLADTMLPTRNCQIYILSMPASSGFADYSDAIVKGLASDPNRIAHCLVQTERTPWSYFIRTGVLNAEAWTPMRPSHHQGMPFPWPRFGDVELAYLYLEVDATPRTDASVLYFEQRAGGFVDVTQAVRDGERAVSFFNARPGQR
jgi:hypothetical protein